MSTSVEKTKAQSSARFVQFYNVLVAEWIQFYNVLVAEWIHFTLFPIILPTIKLKVYTFWGL